MEISAIQLEFDSTMECMEFCKNATPILNKFGGISQLEISTQVGLRRCSFGDWILRDLHGEFYSCTNETFKSVYELIEEENDEVGPVDL